jgi:bacterioferritin-associated ferredoxin
MVVCHCRVVTDGQVRAAVDAGARTVAEIGRHCGAARECGGCRFAVRDLLSATVDAARPASEDDALTVTAAA